MEPGAQQADEADEGGSSTEHQTGDDEDKTQAEQRPATPVLGLRVVLRQGGRKSPRRVTIPRKLLIQEGEFRCAESRFVRRRQRNHTVDR